MEKTKYHNKALVYPLPAILAGALVDDKVNYNTLGNCGIISVNPPVIYISSEKRHHTNIGIRSSGYYSVNIPSTDTIDRTDYCGVVSGKNTDKSNVFETFYGDCDKAPLIKECPVNLLCKVIETVDVYGMDVFIGEVIETYITTECLTEGKPDTTKINPLIYALDNNYWDIGDIVGKGFRDGIKFKDSLSCIG